MDKVSCSSLCEPLTGLQVKTMSDGERTPVQRLPDINRSRNADGLSRQARQFFLFSVAVLFLAAVLFRVLTRVFGRAESEETVVFVPAFLVTTLLLFLGSFSLHFAILNVRRERQQRFRSWLVASLCLGAIFMGVQSYALWSMVPQIRAHESASLGVTAFVICLSGLHCLHFLVATLFVAMTMSRSLANRYDHEYYWGVQVCAWSWHVLGIVWMAILGVIAIAA